MEKFLKNQPIPLTQVTDPNTGQAYYSPQNVVYQDKNNTGVTYLKNVRVDNAISASYFSGSITNAISASYALTASYFSGSITNAISASYALTASYTLNGGGGTTNTGSLLTTSSFSNPNLTFTKGDGSSFNVNLSTLIPTSASYAVSASYVSGSIIAPGSNTQIIYNNGGLLGATGSFVYSGSNVGIGTDSPTSKLSVVGKLSLADGINSIFIGVNAGRSDDGTSNNNIAIGSSSLSSNITGIGNIAIGNGSQFSSSASNNTSVGTNTLFFNTTGVNNTAIGSYSQVSASRGNFNTGVGTNAIFSNTSGSNNTAVGSSAIFSSTSGSNNSGFGVSTLFSNTIGNDNTAVGSFALFNNVSGSENTAFGRSAGRYYSTGTASLTDVSSSIFIGVNSRANAIGETNQIVIGNEALGLGSNTVVIGNDNIITTVLKGNIGIGKINPSTRLDISGSTTITGSLIVTGGITGSLLGTSSYAIQVLSSSYAATASYINPLVQNIIVTGSYNMQSSTGGHTLFFNNSGQLGSTTTGYHILMSPSSNTTFFNQVGYHQNGLNVTPGGNSTTYGLSVTVGSYPTATIATFSSGSVTALSISGSGLRGTGSFNYLGSISATSFTGSLLGTASYATQALSASYANNGGVTQIIAGTNILISPTNGLGAVTINSTGGGGGTGANTTGSFTNQATWVFTHGLNSQFPIIQVLNSSFDQIIPKSITLTDANTVTITFPTSESGYAIASLGGLGTYAATASYVQNAQTASYVLNAVSSSFSSTASYVTNLNQAVIIGNITSTPSTEATLNVYPPMISGTGEGGQILLAASGGLYTSASMLDTYQNQFRLLKGTNTGGSTAAYIITDLQSGNTQFAGAVTASAYSGLPNSWLSALRSGNQTIGSGTWANRDIIFNDVSSNNFTYNSSTGIATLKAGKTYRITSRLAWAAAGVYVLQFRIYNQTTSAFTGPTAEIIQSTNGTNNISDSTLEHIFSVGASDVDISIRTTNITNALTGEYIRGDLNTQLIIQQIA